MSFTSKDASTREHRGEIGLRADGTEPLGHVEPTVERVLARAHSL
ncbi:MAG TPA: hypothetical protein PLS29_01485 [Acidimicrobiales bacterium]|nr:hypothetical protein [Acidimicrobiales bacterium]